MKAAMPHLKITKRRNIMSEETKGIEQPELSPQDLDKVAGGFKFTMLPMDEKKMKEEAIVDTKLAEIKFKKT